MQRWRTLFYAKYEVLLYDLTSTSFESNPPEEPTDMRSFGQPRDKRSDCVQVVIALIVTPEGVPIAYEVLPGNPADKTTLRDFLAKIQTQHGKVDRVWGMDGGTPTEDPLREMRESDAPVSCLVGTRLSQLEAPLFPQPWHHARPVKAEVTLHGKGQNQTATLSYKLDRAPLRVARRREGRYLLRTNLTEADPAKLWEFYLQLPEVEQAFKEIKGDLALGPIYHPLESRIHSHIFVSFLAYCLQVTLKARLTRCASGLTPRAVLEKFAALEMLDVHLPTTDGREIVLTRYTHAEKNLSLLFDQLKLTLPEQAPTKIQPPAKPAN